MKLTKKMAKAVLRTNKYTFMGGFAFVSHDAARRREGSIHVNPHTRLWAPEEPVHRDAHVMPTNWIRALSLAPVAASRDETRPHLCQIYFDGAQVVATDGHRIHAYPFKLPDSIKPFGVPAVDVGALHGNTTLGYMWVAPPDAESSAARVVFRAGPWQLSVPQVEHKFPPVTRVVPDYHGKDKMFLRGFGSEFVERLRAWPTTFFTLTATSGTNALAIHTWERSLWKVSAEQHVSEIFVSPDHPKWGLERVAQIGVNARYLADAIEHVGTHAVVETTGELDPILVREDVTDWRKGAWAVVMPTRI